jgi:ABC-type Na+ efflux pump permease subunit
MVWIALGLVGFTAALVGVATYAGRVGVPPWRGAWADNVQRSLAAVPQSPSAHATQQAVLGAYRQLLREPELRRQVAFLQFTRWVVFVLFLSFLLPLCSLSFATEALGGDRENNSLVWLLTRPLPRPAIYLAKFVALLPWSLAFNLGGFGLICLAGGEAGARAFRLYWPAVLTATLAFAALFHLFGAAFRRPAVVALVYSFFLETILGNMPGTLKRVSVSFYTRCMMYEAARDYGVEPDRPGVFLPVSGAAALLVLAAVTALLLAAGAAWFTRAQYREVV